MIDCDMNDSFVDDNGASPRKIDQKLQQTAHTFQTIEGFETCPINIYKTV